MPKFELVDLEGNRVSIDLARVLSEINKHIVVHSTSKRKFRPEGPETKAVAPSEGESPTLDAQEKGA